MRVSTKEDCTLATKAIHGLLMIGRELLDGGVDRWWTSIGPSRGHGVLSSNGCKDDLWWFKSDQSRTMATTRPSSHKLQIRLGQVLKLADMARSDQDTVFSKGLQRLNRAQWPILVLWTDMGTSIAYCELIDLCNGLLVVAVGLESSFSCRLF